MSYSDIVLVYRGSRWRKEMCLQSVLDPQFPEVPVAQVGNIILKRKDFWGFGPNQELEATIANCCLQSIAMAATAKKDVASKDVLLFPTWTPGHWKLFVMKPKHRQMFIFDSTNPSGLGDQQYLQLFSKLTARLCPGTWVLVKNKNVPQQLKGSVDCGIFMLMYALYVVMGKEFDFTAIDMPTIRKWWCLILIEHFAVKRTDEVTTPERLQVQEVQHPILMDVQKGVKWIQDNRHLLKGSVQEPDVLFYETADLQKALRALQEAEDTEMLVLAKEPFLFIFEFRFDMQRFIEKCSKYKLRINCMFKE